MNNLFSKNFLYYSIILFPLTYVFGVFITELFLGLIVIFFLIKNRNIKYFFDKKFIFLLLVSLYIGLNGFFQIDDNLKISSIFHFRYIIFSLSILFCLEYFEKKEFSQNKILLYSIFLFVFLILVDGIFQFFTGVNFFGYKIVQNRISGIFGSELILGSFLIKILPILTWLLFYYKFEIKKNQKKLIIFFSLSLICIFLTAERTSLGLTLIYFILILIFIKPLKRIFLFSLIISFIFVCLVSTVQLGKTDPVNRIFIKTFNQFTNQYFVKNKTKKLLDEGFKLDKDLIRDNILIFSKDHTGHFKLAFNLFKENPIFGVGPKGFRHHCRKVQYDPDIGICSTHPHNFLVQIISETGLVGFLIYLYIILFIIFKLNKIRLIDNSSHIKRQSLAIISIGLFINLFPFLPSGNFFNNWISIINYYYLGIYFYSYNKVYTQ